MKAFKCKFTSMDLLRILDIINEQISSIETKKPHELSEVLIYRLYALYALQKRFRSKSVFLHPTEISKMTFDLKDVLTLKNCLLGKLHTPGLSIIFMQIDSKIHPAIQLEI